MRKLLLLSVIALLLPHNVLAYTGFHYRDCVRVNSGFFEGTIGRLVERINLGIFIVRVCRSDVCTTADLSSSDLVKIPEKECKDKEI